MVEYSYDEAIAMLERNLSNAQDKLVGRLGDFRPVLPVSRVGGHQAETSEDIDHLKNQSITLEVSNGRVFSGPELRLMTTTLAG